MKTLLLTGMAVLAALAGESQVQAQTTVTVDSTQNWIGYMNVFELPANGGGYDFGSAWGTADLRAYFTGTSNLTLTPNTNVWNPTNTYYVNPDGSPNKSMDASFYVQNDSLAGQNLTFSGTCLSNTLVSPYTSTAFIKDFAPDYSYNTPVSVAMVTGQPFSISLQTGAGDHIQYGFETVGPDANPTNLPNLGQVVMAVNNADPTLSSVASQALVTGQTAMFSVTATGTAPFTYQWSYGTTVSNTNLVNGGRISGATSSTLTIANVMTSDAGMYFVAVTNSKGSGLASAVLTVSPLAQVATNLLVDPGFENGAFATDPMAGWINFNGAREVNTNDFYYLSATPVSVVDGTNCIQTYDSGGAGSYNGIYQDHVALPGQVYTASGYMLTPSADTIGGKGSAWMEVQFVNASGVLVAYYKSSLITSSSPLDTWIKVQPTNHLATDYVTPLGTPSYMVAPAGTAKIRVQFNNLADTGGSVYVDATDLRLREPVTTTAISGGNVHISFPTVYGPTYNVLYKTNLTDASWQTLTSLPGTGTNATVTDPIGTTHRFYIVNTQ